MNIEEYVKQILAVYNDIEVSKKTVEKDSLSYKYIIDVENKLKKTLESIKTIGINKNEINFLKLQEERENVLKSNMDKTTLNLELIKLNQLMVTLNPLRNSS